MGVMSIVRLINRHELERVMIHLPDLPPVIPDAVPRDPFARHGWIVQALRSRGVSLSALSIQAGYTRTYFQQALHRPLVTAEAAIAQALGLTPQQIWPERFDRAGRRLPQRRPGRSLRRHPQDSAAPPACNGKDAKAT